MPGFRYVDLRMMSGPCCTDAGTDLVVDEEGSILVAGFRGSIDLDQDGKIDIPTFGRPDAIVSKVSLVDGVNTGWTRGPGGPTQDRADAVASDRDGGVFVAGMFNEVLQMTETTRLPSAGKSDGFLARYGRDSELDWGRPIGGPGEDLMEDVASDSEGNVVVIGTVFGAVDVDRDGDVDVTAGDHGAALVASFTRDGDLRWLRASDATTLAAGKRVAIGPKDEIYIAGYYRNGAPDFEGDGEPDLPVAEPAPPSVTDPTLLDYNAFYARLNAHGSLVWIRGVSGPASQAVASLAIAANGDLLVLGGYSAPPDFDGDGVPDLEFRSMADRIFKYSLDMNAFLMQVTPGGEGVWTTTYTAAAEHVAATGSRIVMSGKYTNHFDIDDDGVPEREADDDDQYEGFAAILDNEGQLQQVITIVGGHIDVVNAGGFSPDGNTLYLTGHTSSGADFDGDDEIEVASVCHKAGELYLAIYALEGTARTR
ncbi:MAG TPA: hypothetical protein VFP76_02865 [Gemmatimonadota bacterium]|nr:hypothetical protein [Gemmatimonadota bacterium]